MASLRISDCQRIATLELASGQLGSPESNRDKPPEMNLYFSGTVTESEWVPSHDNPGELQFSREVTHPDHPIETCVLNLSLEEYLSSSEQICNAIKATLRRDFSTILVDEEGRQAMLDYVWDRVTSINPHADLSLYFLVDVEAQLFFYYESESCAICLEEYSEDCEAASTPCCHVFHQSCIEKWLQINHCCPICRFQIPTV